MSHFTLLQLLFIRHLPFPALSSVAHGRLKLWFAYCCLDSMNLLSSGHVPAIMVLVGLDCFELWYPYGIVAFLLGGFWRVQREG